MDIEYQTIKFKIVRLTSQYNKYIEWFAECFRKDSSELSSFGFKTEKEARRHCSTRPPMPIGDQLVQTVYEEIKC